VDAPRPVVVSPSPDSTVFSLEQDGLTLLAHASMVGLPLGALWATATALTSLLGGGATLLFAAGWPPLLLAAAAVPCAATCAGLPWVMACPPWVSTGATLLSQAFGTRRGTLLSSVGGAWGAALVAALAGLVPPLVGSALLGSGAILGAPLLLRAAAGELLSGQQQGLLAAYVVALAFHPVLSAGWAVLSGGVLAVASGAISAAAWRASGRRKAADEGFAVDVTGVQPAGASE
jgi:hypothetical protein